MYYYTLYNFHCTFKKRFLIVFYLVDNILYTFLLHFYKTIVRLLTAVQDKAPHYVYSYN